MLTENEIKTLPYRLGVIAFILDSENKLLIIKNKGYKENEWTNPGGGVEEGETFEVAVLRELKEELGCDCFKIEAVSKNDLKYDFSLEHINERYKYRGVYQRGQIKKQFLVRFTGEKESIKLNISENTDYKWININDINKYFIFPNQAENAFKFLKEFNFIK